MLRAGALATLCRMRPVVCMTRKTSGPPFDALIGAVELRVGFDRVEEAMGILCFPGDLVDRSTIERGGRLRVIATASVGYDHIDVSAARERNVTVTHTPGVLTDATAELTFALMLAAARRVVEADRFVRSGAWRGFRFDLLLGLELAGSTLGVVGAGRIGTAVIERARAFGMRIFYTNRNPRPALDAGGAERVSLDALLCKSDVVSLHVPLSTETHHLIGTRELALLKPGAILVNTARGPIVDEAALVEGLRAGRPAAAGLDVFEHEPLLSPGLIELENVVLLPHLGSATARTRRRMAASAVTDLLAVLEGRAPCHAVP